MKDRDCCSWVFMLFITRNKYLCLVTGALFSIFHLLQLCFKSPTIARPGPTSASTVAMVVDKRTSVRPYCGMQRRDARTRSIDRPALQHAAGRTSRTRARRGAAEIVIGARYFACTAPHQPSKLLPPIDQVDLHLGINLARGR